VSGCLDPDLGVPDPDEEWRRRSPPEALAETVVVVHAVMPLHCCMEGAWFRGIYMASSCSALHTTGRSIAWPSSAAIYGAHGVHSELNSLFVRDTRCSRGYAEQLPPSTVTFRSVYSRMVSLISCRILQYPQAIFFSPITRILISLPDAFQKSPALGCEQNVRGPRSAYHCALRAATA
jgi:hypothetical protein